MKKKRQWVMWAIYAKKVGIVEVSKTKEKAEGELLDWYSSDGKDDFKIFKVIVKEV